MRRRRAKSGEAVAASPCASAGRWHDDCGADCRSVGGDAIREAGDRRGGSRAPSAFCPRMRRWKASMCSRAATSAGAVRSTMATITGSAIVSVSRASVMSRVSARGAGQRRRAVAMASRRRRLAYSVTTRREPAKPDEGYICKLKTLKRQMDGRANLGLLRARFIL